MAIKPDKTPLTAFVVLILAGVILAALYVTGSSALCKPVKKPLEKLESIGRPQERHEDKIQNSKQRQYRPTNYPGLTGVAYASNDAVTSETGHREEGHKYGSWFKDFFCESKVSDVVIAFFTWCLVVVTGWLAWATLKLWAATKRIAEDADTATKVIQRAYISVLAYGVKAFQSTPSLIACDVGIQNGGNLPATKVRWAIYREFSTEKKRRDFPINDEDLVEHGITVGPKDVAMKGGQRIEAKEFWAYARDAGIDDRWLYVWGRIRYLDGFGKDRRTDFCHRYNLRAADGNSMSGPHIGGPTARHHEFGNYSD